MTAPPTESAAEDRGRCANCAAPLQGPFCHACGQSRQEVDRAFLPLVSDALDGVLAWDGRLLCTVRSLYARPGRVARDYMDGRRARYSPPVRLYLIVSLVFFAVMTWSGLRVVALDMSNEEGEISVAMRMWQSGEAPPPLLLDAAERARFVAFAREAGTPAPLIDLALAAMEDPARVESAATSSASQAQILMVILFAAMNLPLHPRRRIIEHLVHALYLHAAILPVSATLILVSVYVPMRGAILVAWFAAAWVIVTALIWAFDRGFYRSSWWGALLRSQALLVAYVAALVSVMLVLMMVQVLLA